jgi:hypothetical protein
MVGAAGAVGEGQGFGPVLGAQHVQLPGHFVQGLVPGDPLPFPFPARADPLQGVVDAPGMIDVLGHEQAALADQPSGHRMVGVAADLDHASALDVQQGAAAGVAQPAVAPADLVPVSRTFVRVIGV